ncbi:hypothetical protein SODALDRAFT_357685 [Sodiomyces alkalinus F11]|uniref:Uncharacterized protein n=1 Tax=Sodiomyces alkalinus (strain CBS 110278 / VKM F-3762 / F11) TaxID=1314773 RepID=A0A3N2Q4D8_SODAK|nr:hypothetical protein SODALDRAFT_357685 [Sodiomyces alkalinus F11]ROT41622.1 hypothetical protein SODALDRAFT_357685 [Sodiomyces alkalinus F11]
MDDGEMGGWTDERMNKVALVIAVTASVFIQSIIKAAADRDTCFMVRCIVMFGLWFSTLERFLEVHVMPRPKQLLCEVKFGVVVADNTQIARTDLPPETFPSQSLFNDIGACNLRASGNTETKEMAYRYIDHQAYATSCSYMYDRPHATISSRRQRFLDHLD